LAKLLTLNSTFQNTSSFNQALNDWDISGVLDMSSIFF